MTSPARTPSRAALAVLLCGTFMASLDTAIVNVAGPAIQADVGVSGAALQLVISGYALAYAALLITGARLGDDHGHRRLFLLGLAGFTVTSLVAGLAWSTEVLIVARVGQGVAAAAMGPQVMTVIQLQYDGAARMKAMALLATVVSAGVVVGQVLGGALVDLDLLGASWRPVFLINVPVGLALLAIGPRLLPVTRLPRGRALDWVGVLLMTDVITLVMVPLVFGHEVDWAWWTWACLAAAAPTAIALALHLRRVRTRGGAPVADFRLLARPRFGLGMASTTAVMIAYGGFLFTFTLHLQQGLGDSPLRAGLTFAPYAVGFAVTSLGVPALAPALGRRPRAGRPRAGGGRLPRPRAGDGRRGRLGRRRGAAAPAAGGRGLRRGLQPGHHPRDHRRARRPGARGQRPVQHDQHARLRARRATLGSAFLSAVEGGSGARGPHGERVRARRPRLRRALAGGRGDRAGPVAGRGPRRAPARPRGRRGRVRTRRGGAGPRAA